MLLLALLALIRAAQGDDAKAEAALKALKPLLDAIAEGEPYWLRWPELVAATGVQDRPLVLSHARSRPWWRG